MDAVTALHESLDPRTVEALPIGVRARLEMALRRCRKNTLHAYVPWIGNKKDP